MRSCILNQSTEAYVIRLTVKKKHNVLDAPLGFHHIFLMRFLHLWLKTGELPISESGELEP